MPARERVSINMAIIAHRIVFLGDNMAAAAAAEATDLQVVCYFVLLGGILFLCGENAKEIRQFTARNQKNCITLHGKYFFALCQFSKPPEVRFIAPTVACWRPAAGDACMSSRA
jgi:hypothetical protein